MCVAEGEAVEHASLIAPRVEAELAFILARPLSGPGVTGAEVIRATECVVPCIEIIDSRVRDWTIGIADTVADNASSARYVLGHQPMRLADIDPRLIGMSLHVRGELVSTGAGLACLGSPINAVAWLANTLGRLGVGLEAGQVILSGALGPVSPVSAGDWVSARVGSASAVSVRFT